MQLTDTRYGKAEPVTVHVARYRNGQQGIFLETLDGEPWCVATAAVDEPLKEGTVAVKVHSENVGMQDLLIRAGVIEREPLDYIRSGFVLLPVHALTPAAKALGQAHDEAEAA